MNSGGWSGCDVVACRLRSLYMSSVGISPGVCSGCALTALEGSTSAGTLTWVSLPSFHVQQLLTFPFCPAALRRLVGKHQRGQ